MYQRPTLVIMAKAPVAGTVKTRLAREIGMVPALAAYRTILRETVRRLSADPRWRVVLAVAPDHAAHPARFAFMGVPSGRFDFLPQGAGDLGRRMQNALRRAGLRSARARKNRCGAKAVPPARTVVLIGSDIPGIARNDIAAAFRAARRADVVIGPAPDGGYWLIGLNAANGPCRPFAPLLSVKGPQARIRWSSAHARADTLAALSRFSVVETIQKADIDTAADWRAWRG